MRIKEQVANILAVSRPARNSDKELLIIYMQKYGLELSEKQIAKFKQMPSAESITRARRLIQMEGKYPADQVVDQGRFERYTAMRTGEVGEALELLS